MAAFNLGDCVRFIGQGPSNIWSAVVIKGGRAPIIEFDGVERPVSPPFGPLGPQGARTMQMIWTDGAIEHRQCLPTDAEISSQWVASAMAANQKKRNDLNAEREAARAALVAKFSDKVGNEVSWVHNLYDGMRGETVVGKQQRKGLIKSINAARLTAMINVGNSIEEVSLYTLNTSGGSRKLQRRKRAKKTRRTRV